LIKAALKQQPLKVAAADIATWAELAGAGAARQLVLPKNPHQQQKQQ
jgi:hypothetical protein